MPPVESAAEPSEPKLLSKAFVSVTVTSAIFFLYIGMVLVIVPRFIEDELGAGEFGVGLSVASFAAAAVAIRPFLGRWTERYGRRAVMMAGATIAAVTGAAIGLSTSLWQVIVLRGAMGIGEAMVFVAAATLIADLSPPRRRAEAASYFSVAVFSGIGFGPTIAERVLGDDRYAAAFMVAAGFAAVSAITVLGVPSRVDRSQPVPSKLPFFHRAALWPGIVLASGIAGFAVWAAFLPEYSLSVGLAGSAGLFLVYSLVSIVLRIGAAKLPERLGEHRMVTIALTGLAGSLILVGVVGEVWALWAGAVGMGVGMAFLYPSLMANVVNQVPDGERATALSSFTMFFEVGSIAGGLALGAVGEIFSKQAGFVGGAVMAVAGLWVLWQRVDEARAPEAVPAVAPAA